MKYTKILKTTGCLAAVLTITTGNSFGFGSSWTPSGSNTTYHYGPGGNFGTSWRPSGSNTTYHSGSLFRGDSSNPLFKNEEIANAFPATDWIDASAARDTAWMLNLAWQLDGIERRLDTVDEKTTSDALYTATAEMAVAQRNQDILEQMANIWPDAKEHLEEVKALGATRGENAVNPMPRLTQPAFNEEGELQEPAYGTAYISSAPLAIHQYGANLDWATANNVADALNNGRMSNSPVTLASAAVELAEANPDKASTILEEAAELAVETENQSGLDFVVSIYESGSPLANAEKANTYSEIAESVGSTRGGFDWMDSVGARTLRWDGSKPRAELLNLYYQGPQTTESWR